MIYFIECAGRVKIGHSNNPKRRLEILSTGMPFPCKLIGVMYGGPAEERDLHEKFSGSREHREWFVKTDHIAEFVASNSIKSVGVEDGDFVPFITPEEVEPDTRHPLAIWRKARKLSQYELAAEVGVSRWMVNRIERGERNPSLKLAIKVQEITDGAVTAKDFAGRAAQ